MLKVFRFISAVGLMAACLLVADVRGQHRAVSHRIAIDGMYPIMLNALQEKNYGRARNICEQVILWEPQNPVHHYNLACIDAQAGGSRLGYAWGSLELAIALGFNDAQHLQTDPDLAPLREDPRFADLVRKVIFNVSAGAAAASITFPAPGKSSPANALVDEFEKPAAPTVKKGVPSGLFLMTRYLPATQGLERDVWYFGPDGDVYRNLKDGFSKSDLAAHSGPRGKLSGATPVLEIVWHNGERTAAELEPDGAGFTWDMGMFVPITAFEDSTDVAGIYEGAESVGIESNDVPVSQRLELNADGTFRWNGVSFARAESGSTRLSTASSAVSTG
ncbi:MAG: TPR end-of-group domain-containing protein, partial [Opitutaceae bacterium]